jgi:DNA-3-methyladenine glycosylase II
MLLMFALCREDVFALDDLGLQNAMIGLYELKHRKKKTL